jgi:hypothetical protein
MILANAIIAGVNKAGTTSLFVSLSSHPEVFPAAVKETSYFLPPRWGQPIEDQEVYEAYFSKADTEPIRLEATPAYFYGGQPVIDAMKAILPSNLRILVVLREPVERFWSFFTFQKARLRIPKEMSALEYLAKSDGLTDSDFSNPSQERWFAFQGGCYADYLPVWHEALGENLEIIYFDELMKQPQQVLKQVARFLNIDSELFPSLELARENQTTGYKRSGLQRFALAVNTHLEKFLRRHYGLKEKLRSMYYRINGSTKKEKIPEDIRTVLADRYQAPNAQLRSQLQAMGRKLPRWLEG